MAAVPVPTLRPSFGVPTALWELRTDQRATTPQARGSPQCTARAHQAEHTHLPPGPEAGATGGGSLQGTPLPNPTAAHGQAQPMGAGGGGVEGPVGPHPPPLAY